MKMFRDEDTLAAERSSTFSQRDAAVSLGCHHNPSIAVCLRSRDDGPLRPSTKSRDTSRHVRRHHRRHCDVTSYRTSRAADAAED